MVVTLDPAADFHAGELVQVTVTDGIESTTPTSATPVLWQFRSAVEGGNGVFGDSGQSLGNGDSRSVSLGDVDGDGDLDAFVANRDGQGNRVWLNDGGGNFTDGGQSLGNGNSKSVRLGDVDGDGDLDAFVANDDVSIFRGNRVWVNDGSGNFTDSGQSLGNLQSQSVSLGDVDGDGDLDAFVANGLGGNRVWINDGGGNFTDSRQILGDHSSTSASLGDVDGDGDLDAFVTNYGPGKRNRVWLNDGGGNFSDSGQILGDHGSTSVSLGDVDGDGDLDAFVANANNKDNRVWLNDGSGNFTDSGQGLGEHRSTSVSLGDVDGDGDLDAFVAKPALGSPGNRVWLNLNLADLSISKTSGQVAVVQGGEVAYTIVVSNAGPADVAGATVRDILSAQLENLVLTSITPAGGATSSLSIGPIAGAINDTVNLPNGATITYTVTGTVVPAGTADAAVETIVTNPATVTAPLGVLDKDLSNNTVHNSDRVVLAVTGGSGVFTDSGQNLGDQYSLRVSLGDLDGDGDLDAFVANNDVSIYRGNRVWINDGSGNFTDNGQSLGNGNSRSVSLGDLDGDGDLDAFVANANQGNRVWLNDGSGNFTDSGQSLGGGNSQSVRLGDVDGDGDLDAFIANFLGQANRVWLNDGNGYFTDSGQGLGNDNSQSVSLGDVDGDGDLDAFLANSGEGNRVWLNDGGGNFTDGGQSLGDRFSRGASLGDVDGDGDLDAFVANFNQGNRVWLNDGGGNFADSGQSLGNASSQSVRLGDVDGDGDLDAFLANFNQGNRVWRNDGSGNFIDSGQTLGDQFSTSVSLGDVDGDGDLDAFLANGYTGNRVWLNRNRTDLSIRETSGEVAVVQGGEVTYTIVVSNAGLADVTGATVHDTFPTQLENLVLTRITPAGGATSSLSIGPIAGALNDTVNLPDGSTITYTATGTVVPAGAADTSVETIVTNTATVTAPSDIYDPDLTNNTARDSDVVVLAVTDVSGVFTDSGQNLGNYVSFSVRLGDLDGDGNLDAFVGNGFGEGNRVWLGNGSGNFTDSGQNLGNHESRGVSLGDVDGDGDLDAFIANFLGQANRVWLNDGNGNFTDSGQSLGSGNSQSVRLGDVDGDGDLDAFVANEGQGNRVWLNDGSGNFTDSGQNLGNYSSQSVRLGDVDGDGDLDAFVANFGKGNRVWLNDGSGNFADSGQTLGDHLSLGVSLGDVDGDGDLDAFVSNRNQGNRVWLNDGSGNFTDSGQSLGDRFSRGASLGDVDGDGDLDAFIANYGVGNRVWLNDSSGSFTDGGQTLGDPISLGVSLGDVDGDGDLDAFVANDFTGNRVWLNRNPADLSISKTSGQVAVVQGGEVTYTIVVSNAGPADVAGATVHDTFPTQLENLVLTRITPAGGATSSLSIGPIAGSLNDTVNLPDSSTITYTVTGTVAPAGTVDAAVETIVTNTATVTAPVGVLDKDLSNNTAHDSDVMVLAVTAGSGVFGDSGQSLGDRRSQSVSLGDVDGDGDLDAFVANGFGEGNRVWLGDGSGNFADNGQNLGNHESGGVSLGDVDGDGDLDAFVANVNQGNRVWINDGSGNFADSGQSLGDRRSQSVSLGDVDGDGDLDAFVTNVNQGNRVWINDGSGNFTDSGQSLGDRFSRSASLGDVDGDGDLDAFVANDGDGNRVWLNDGSGNFADSGQSLGDLRSRSVRLGDVDGDGDLDAFVANDGDGNRVWLNDGSGNFTDSGQSLGDDASRGLSLGDVDGDLDALVAYRNLRTVWLNDGSGNFTGSRRRTDHLSTSVSLGDVDGDGDLDAFVANYGEDNRVWLNRNLADLSISATAGQVAVVQGGEVTYTIVVSNAGPEDVAAATVRDTFPTQLENLVLTSITPAGGATSSLSIGPVARGLFDTVNLPNGSTITYTATGTVVPAGTADMAVETIITSSASVIVSASFPVGVIDNDFSNNTARDSDVVVLAVTGGSGVYADSGQSLGDHASESVSLGDVDGDGDLDAFVANYGEGNRVWLNDGSGHFTDSGQRLGNDYSLDLSLGVSLGDVDGDGDLDAFVANGLGQANRVWLNDGSGHFIDSHQSLGDHASTSVRLADLTGSGRPEAFVTNANDRNRVQFNDGRGNFFGSLPLPGDHASSGVSLGDVDGDGDLDAFVANTDEGNRVWLNDGSGNFTASGQSLGDHRSTSVSLGDLDSDGDLDAFIANYGEGNRVWLNLDATDHNLLGDMDLNGTIDFDDITEFAFGLTDAAGYETSHGLPPVVHGDTDANGIFDFDDIAGFVTILADSRLQAGASSAEGPAAESSGVRDTPNRSDWRKDPLGTEGAATPVAPERIGHDVSGITGWITVAADSKKTEAVEYPLSADISPTAYPAVAPLAVADRLPRIEASTRTSEGHTTAGKATRLSDRPDHAMLRLDGSVLGLNPRPNTPREKLPVAKGYLEYLDAVFSDFGDA